MPRPLLSVNFNEMVAPDVVLLSRTDIKTGSNGEAVTLFEGLEVTVYEDEVDEQGLSDRLMATGLVEANREEGRSSHVKWCCRINAEGVRYQSEM